MPAADQAPGQAKQGEYPDGSQDIQDSELTIEELKEAFRWTLDSHGRHDGLLWSSCARIFDDVGDGFITVARFRDILKEIDEDISDEELDGIIADVSCAIKFPIWFWILCLIMLW